MLPVVRERLRPANDFWFWTVLCSSTTSLEQISEHTEGSRGSGCGQRAVPHAEVHRVWSSTSEIGARIPFPPAPKPPALAACLGSIWRGTITGRERPPGAAGTAKTLRIPGPRPPCPRLQCPGPGLPATARAVVDLGMAPTGCAARTSCPHRCLPLPRLPQRHPGFFQTSAAEAPCPITDFRTPLTTSREAVPPGWPAAACTRPPLVRVVRPRSGSQAPPRVAGHPALPRSPLGLFCPANVLPLGGTTPHDDHHAARDSSPCTGPPASELLITCLRPSPGLSHVLRDAARARIRCDRCPN